MKLFTTALTSTILAAGVVGSVAAYRTQVEDVGSVEGATTSAQPTRSPARADPRVVVRWAPCPDGSRLEKGVCVSDVVRTVVIPTAPAPSSPPAPAPTSTRSDRGDDDAGWGDDADDDTDEDDDGDEDDDDGDNDGDEDDDDADGEDDGHEDDGHEDDEDDGDDGD